MVTGVEHVSEGWETVIHALALADEDVGRHEDLVLRAYPGGYAAHKATAEYQVMVALGRAGFPVPRLLALELDPAVLGQPFVLMERVDGGPASDAAYAAPFSDRHRHVAEFAALQHAAPRHGLARHRRRRAGDPQAVDPRRPSAISPPTTDAG